MTGPFAFLDNLTIDPMKAVGKSLKVLQQNQEMLQNGITDEQRKKAYYPRVSESMFHNINPFGYDGHDDQIKQAVKDIFFRKDIPTENRWSNASNNYNGSGERLDAFSLYLGLPQKHGTFKVSNYKPERGDDNTSYFSIPKVNESMQDPEDIKRAVETLQRAKHDPVLIGRLSNGAPITENKYSIRYPKTKDKGIVLDEDPTNTMGHYKLSMGKDDKGNYLSYYDKWDLDPTEDVGAASPYLTNMTKLAGLGVKMIGHPFEIYDRIYYDPKTYKPIK